MGQAVSKLYWNSTSQAKEIIVAVISKCNLRFSASADVVDNAQPAKPTIAAISTPAALCSGGSLNSTAPVTVNGSTISSQGCRCQQPLEVALCSSNRSLYRCL
jgi:hypothetical protein